MLQWLSTNQHWQPDTVVVGWGHWYDYITEGQVVSPQRLTAPLSACPSARKSVDSTTLYSLIKEVFFTSKVVFTHFSVIKAWDTVFIGEAFPVNLPLINVLSYHIN